MQPLDISSSRSGLSMTGEESLQQKLGKITARTVQEICSDSNDRLLRYKENATHLQKGVFMQNKYFLALRETKQKPRLDWMISKNRCYDFHPPEHFELVPNTQSDSGFAGGVVRLKQSALPSDALKAAKQGLALLDCTTVCQIGQYQAIHDVIGTDKFNKIFSQAGKRMRLSNYADQNNPLLGFLKLKKGAAGEKNHRVCSIGDRLVFKNDPRYSIKHQMMGDSQNFNVICIDDTPGAQKFVGLGLSSDGSTEEEVESLCLAEHNSAPMDMDFLSDALAEKLFVGGKQGYKERCAFFNPQNGADKTNFLRRAGIPEAQWPAVSAQFDAVNTLSREEVSEDFGYSPELRTVFRTEVIQKIIDTPIDKL